MTRMVSSDRDYDDDPPRSIFAALWFRALVVILVLGIIAAVAVPYVLDVVNPPTKSTEKGPTPPPALAPSAPSTPPTAAMPPSAVPSTPASPPTAAPAPKASEPATLAETAKPAEPPKVSETPRAVEPPKAAETPKKAPPRFAAVTPSRTAAAGPYWVQVGAFKDQATAKRVAEQLRGQRYKVEESAKGGAAAVTPTPAPAPAPGPGAAADLYDVFVSGTTLPDISARLGGKGLAAESVAGGVVVKPSLPLREAVALSRDLAADGLKVQVRRAGAAPGTPASTATGPSGDTLHRVRVGSYPDRASAQTVLRELEGKGFKPFIARGD